MSIKLLIDSASDISLEEAKSLGIEMISLTVSFGDVEYLDGVDLLPTRFYEMLVEEDTIPKTSQVSPERFKNVLTKLTENKDEVIVITISSKLSGTYSSAMLASKSFGEKVHVIDSYTVALGERLLCLLALKYIKQGLSVKEIVDNLEHDKTKINIIAMVNTLEYLKKGGRISPAVAFAGEVFGIKPVVAIVDGEVKVIGKAIGSKKANNLLNKMIEQRGGINFNMPCGVFWSGFDDSVMRKYIKDSAHIWEGNIGSLPIYPLGCTIGTHVGPGTIGFAFFGNE